MAWGALLSLLAVSTPVAAVQAAEAPGSAEAVESSSLIVRGQPDDPHGAVAAVERAGGTVTDHLPIVDGVVAEVPAGAAAALRAAPEVVAVSENGAVDFQTSTSGSATIRSVYPKSTGAEELWKSGTTGRGVTVAVVDSGIADVPDLAGRIVEVTDTVTGERAPCVDLSGERSCADTFGHGTFMAGIIAGDGTSSNGRWKGMAPEASLV